MTDTKTLARRLVASVERRVRSGSLSHRRAKWAYHALRERYLDVLTQQMREGRRPLPEGIDSNAGG